MRFSLPLFPVLLLACQAGPSTAFSAEEFRLPGRAGLFAEPGFEGVSDHLTTVTENGWMGGTSWLEGKSSAWVTNPSDGKTWRVGTLPEAALPGAEVGFAGVSENGVAWGRVRYLDGMEEREAIWIADGVTGVTRPAGLRGVGYTTSSGYSAVYFVDVTKDGLAFGSSTRFEGNRTVGGAPWMMDGRTGVVTPLGLHDAPAHATAEGASDSYVTGFSPDGWIHGLSVRYQPPGMSAWVARVEDAAAARAVGMPPADGKEGGSDVQKMWRNGRMLGTSEGIFSGSPARGVRAWVGDAATGELQRIGLHEGAAYTHPSTGAQMSEIDAITDSGHVAGWSRLYRNTTFGVMDAGSAQWVADGATGVTRRVGFFEGGEFTREGRADGSITGMTESGWVHGFSERYRVGPGQQPGEPPAGQAAWVAEASTGAVRRVGLTGGDFLSVGNGPLNTVGRASSTVEGMTESGWAYGSSVNYVTRERDLWVARASTGETRPMGLTGPEFTAPSGHRNFTVSGMTEEGKIAGATTRWRGAETFGRAVWVGDAATGEVRRVGLTEGAFTRAADGWQESRPRGWIAGGAWFQGESALYQDGTETWVPWVAAAATGETLRMDLDGPGASVISGSTEEGLVYGFTGRPGPAGVRTGAAWVVDLRSGHRTVFDLSARPGDGHSFSEIQGITPEGIVYGAFILYQDGASGVMRAFVYEEGLGTLILEAGSPGAAGADIFESLPRVLVKPGRFAVVARDSPSPGSVHFGKLPVAPASGTGLSVTDLVRLPDGKHRLSFHTDAAVRITLQSSVDLTIWKDAQTIDAPAGASHIDIEADPAAGPQAYWRLKTASAAP